MRKTLQEQELLKDYVTFVGKQYHQAIDEEQRIHDKQVNVLRAGEEVGRIEAKRVREAAKAEVMAAKKEVRTLANRIEAQSTREVEATLALGVERENVARLEGRVKTLEAEVSAKAQRLSEWENLADKQKAATHELERLKKALTVQARPAHSLVEQRSQLEQKEADTAKAQEKIATYAKLQTQGASYIASLQKEGADKAHVITSLRSEVERLRSTLQHRDALLVSTATRVMLSLDKAKDQGRWLEAKVNIEAIATPLLNRHSLGDGDPDAIETEQARQRAKLQEGILKMQEALRHEAKVSEQQNLLRMEENLELTHELNSVRKRASVLQAELTKLTATLKFERERHRRQLRSRHNSCSAPELYTLTSPPRLQPLATRACSSPSSSSSSTSSTSRFRPMTSVHSSSRGRTGCCRMGRHQPDAASSPPCAPSSAPPGTLASAPPCAPSSVPPCAPASSAAPAGDSALEPASAQAQAPPPLLASTRGSGLAQGHGSDSQRHRTLGAEAGGRGASCTPTPASRSGITRGGVTKPRAHEKWSTQRGRGVKKVLLAGEGARDYSSLLKGAGVTRGRELEARAATAEAEVG
ncbi:unnamed protein product [Discosporangium mesarthrocarpum]